MVGDEVTREYFGGRDIPLGLGRAQDINREALHSATSTMPRVEVSELSLVWKYYTRKGRFIAGSLHQNASVIAYKFL
jgi:hypothetical protein